LADKPEQNPKKLEKTFSSDFFSSLAKSLATTLAVGILGFTLQNFFAQRAQISVASVGHSDARYSNLVIIDNYSFSALENIQISFETPSIRIESQSQDTPISVERASPTEQSITVSKVFPLRRFTINFITPTPLDQSKINTIGGPYGASFVRSDRLTSPIYSELLAYVVFVYMPMALMLIFFSLRLRRSHDRLSEESKSMIASADDLRKELDVVRRSTNEKLALLKKTYLLRMSRLNLLRIDGHL
jgi:hypothetical protein